MAYQFRLREKPLEFYPEFDNTEELLTTDFTEAWQAEVSRTSSDPYILWVQESLNKILKLRLALSGDAGPQTRSAIRSFQSKKGLKPQADGVVCLDTERALIAAGAASPPVMVLARAPEKTPPALTVYMDIPLQIPLGKAKSMTGIFVPENYCPLSKVDLIVYLHGFKVRDHNPEYSIDTYWSLCKFRLREEVNKSQKNVILVAPTLGPRNEPGSLTCPGGFDKFLDQVMMALKQHSPYSGTQITPSIGNIILACHSGSGSVMRAIAMGPDNYATQIQECWAFEPANMGNADGWANWAKSHPMAKLYIHFLPDTSGQRLCEGLIGRGGMPKKCDMVNCKPNIFAEESFAIHDNVPARYLKDRIQGAKFLGNKSTCSINRTRAPGIGPTTNKSRSREAWFDFSTEPNEPVELLDSDGAKEVWQEEVPRNSPDYIRWVQESNPPAAEFDFVWETGEDEFEDSEGIDEDAPERFDSEWDNPLESENPNPTGAVAAKGVLKRAGLTTTTRVNKRTPSLIQSVLEQSLVLRPFIAAKLGKIAIPKNFVHYRSDPEFDYAYLKLTKIVVPFGSTEEKELINIRGFYHRPTDSFHFRPSANVGIALQLAINRFSSPPFRDFLGQSLYEGVGLYFTNLVLDEQGLAKMPPNLYKDQLRCATDLIELVGRGMVGKAYFQNHLDLVRHLTTKLSVGPVRTDKLARDALCKTDLLSRERSTRQALLSRERFTRQHVGITDQIQFIEVGNVSASRSNGRVVMARLPQVIGRMSDAKKVQFISRFIDPMLKHDVARKTIIELNRRSQGNHVVQIAWANGQFGGNGTVALNRREAVGGRGSGSMIFIDEQAPDLKRLETLRSNPDVLLFHELVHAFHNQAGTTVNDGAEMERRVIGIGNHSQSMRTENGYRRAKSLPSRCCPDREQL
ncbi:MAG: peptidoglycan-binding protein [Methylococcales bacterium]